MSSRIIHPPDPSQGRQGMTIQRTAPPTPPAQSVRLAQATTQTTVEVSSSQPSNEVKVNVPPTAEVDLGSSSQNRNPKK